MPTGNPMTLRSQIAIAIVAVCGLLLLVRLLQKRRINEGLFYLWLVVFGGMMILGLSHSLQAWVTRAIGAYSEVSSMLLLSLGFLFGASLVYSVLISNMNAKIRDLTAYVAEIRLDVDDLEEDSAEVGSREAGGSSGTGDGP